MSATDTEHTQDGKPIEEAREYQRLMERMLKTSQKIKHVLSSAPSVTQTLEVIPGEYDMTLTMTRDQLNSLLSQQFEDIISNVVQDAIDKAIAALQPEEPEQEKPKKDKAPKEEKRPEKGKQSEEEKPAEEDKSSEEQQQSEEEKKPEENQSRFAKLPLEAVQIIGGSSRIVLFQTVLQRAFNSCLSC